MYDPQKDPKLPTITEEPKIVRKEEYIDGTFWQIHNSSIKKAKSILDKIGKMYGDDAIIKFRHIGYDGAVEYYVSFEAMETEEEFKERYKKEKKKQDAYIKNQQAKYDKMNELKKEFEQIQK